MVARDEPRRDGKANYEQTRDLKVSKHGICAKI
jgi:hypothetical protein